MIDTFLIGTMRNFVYLISFDGKSVVVDPQPNLAPWQARLKELGTKLSGVLLTHTHHDHVGGVPVIAREYADVPFYLHEKDAHRLNAYAPEVRARFSFVEDGQRIALGSHMIEVWHTPGHSAGETSYLIKDFGPQWHLFTGDTVFVGDVGRTDLDTASDAEMFQTLQKLKALPPSTVIYPGHDYGRTPTSTIGAETRSSAAFLCKTVEELHALP